MGNDKVPTTHQSAAPPQSPNKRGSSPGTKLLIGCCSAALLLIVVGTLAIVFWLRSPEGSGYLAIIPHDKQPFGEKLAWRTLAEFPKLTGMMSSIAAGNFDDTPGQDILFVTLESELRLVRLDGSMVKLADAEFDYAHRITVWDWDADGIDEIVLDETRGRHQDVGVYGMDGKLRQRLPDHRMGAYSIVGDYDGDGYNDLMLIDPGGPGAWIYTKNGQLLEKLDCIDRSNPLMLTDLDNDGLAEVIVYEYENFKVYAYGEDPEIVDWPAVNYDRIPNWAMDLTGDNIPELINPIRGMLDITSAMIPLQYDSIPDLDFLDSPDTITCCVFNQTPEGPPSLVVVPGNFNAGPIFMFDPDGTMTYHQQLNPEPIDCMVLKTESQEYLVVTTEEQMLIYP